MASSINTVTISGNLTRDAEVRETASGNAVVSFTVAVNDRRKNPQTGEWEDCPNFVPVTMFGNYAKALAHDMKKGSKVAVMGKLRWSQWERDGQKRDKLEVIADSLELMTRGQRVPQPQQQYDQQPTGAQPRNWRQAYNSIQDGTEVPQPDVATVYDDEIPF